MNLHKMIEICLKDDNMHRFMMINALICINIYVITCINSMLSWDKTSFEFFDRRLRGATWMVGWRERSTMRVDSVDTRSTQSDINARGLKLT